MLSLQDAMHKHVIAPVPQVFHCLCTCGFSTCSPFVICNN